MVKKLKCSGSYHSGSCITVWKEDGGSGVKSMDLQSRTGSEGRGDMIFMAAVSGEKCTELEK